MNWLFVALMAAFALLYAVRYRGHDKTVWSAPAAWSRAAVYFCFCLLAGSLTGALDATLGELRTTLASFSGNSAMQARLQRTLSELDLTLQSLRKLLDTLDDQPNALIFNRTPGEDPEPPAGSQ